MIITTELLDKTFIVAAMLSMKHRPSVVFVGAASALILMTVFSALAGRFISDLIPPHVTHYGCVFLFAIFGILMIHEGIEADEGDEFSDVEMELKQADCSVSVNNAGHPVFSVRIAQKLKSLLRTQNAIVAGQAFVLTFFGEWGDRSQIATVGLAAQGETLGVSLGGFAGHLLCTAIAVMGGRALSTKITVKQVNIAGGALFLVFALIGLALGQ